MQDPMDRTRSPAITTPVAKSSPKYHEAPERRKSQKQKRHREKVTRVGSVSDQMRGGGERGLEGRLGGERSKRLGAISLAWRPGWVHAGRTRAEKPRPSDRRWLVRGRGGVSPMRVMMRHRQVVCDRLTARVDRWRPRFVLFDGRGSVRCGAVRVCWS